jgi:uncharacterized spore protein YtfJ
MATHSTQQSLLGGTILPDILDRIKESANVRLVYGEPSTVGDKTIVPVAAVAYAFGGGGGGGQGPMENDTPVGLGGGGGGGGAVRVQPIGLLEVTPSGTKLHPVLDWTQIITSLIGLLGIWLRIRGRRKSR